VTMFPTLLSRAVRFLALPALVLTASTAVRADDPAPAPTAPEPAAPTAPEPAAPAADAPKAAAASGKRWMLKFSHGPLQRILVDDGKGAETTYMYMLFSVTNETAFPRPWQPLVTATLDTRKERPYIAGGFPIALERLRKKVDDANLKAVEQTWGNGQEGKIQNGETKSLVAIFGPVDAGWSSFHVEFHGLVNPDTTLRAYKYGDNAFTYSDPAYVERNAAVVAEATKAAGGAELPKPTAEYQNVIEKRVWAVDYARKGDEFRPDDDPIEFVGEKWKVLGEPRVIPKIEKK